MPLKPGDPAPDFRLQGPDGPFTLSAHRGQKVVLLFYPGDFTTVCTKQLCTYRDAREDLEGLDMTAVAISPQDVDSTRRFKDKFDLTIPMLADPGGETAKAYGVHTPVGTRRSTFVVDEEGTIHAAKVHLLGARYEKVKDIEAMLAQPKPA